MRGILSTVLIPFLIFFILILGDIHTEAGELEGESIEYINIYLGLYGQSDLLGEGWNFKGKTFF